MNKEKNIIETIKSLADKRKKQTESGLGSFLLSLIEVQEQEGYKRTASFAKRYESIYKAHKK